MRVVWTITEVVTILLVVVLSITLVDGAFRGKTLKADVEIVELSSLSAAKHDTLIVYLPGLLADGEWSVRNMTDTWRYLGDVWLVNPHAELFDATLVAKAVASALNDEKDHHTNVIFIGSSLGAHEAIDVLARLNPVKRANASFGLLAVCSPGQGAQDIKQPLRAMSGIVRLFRFGWVANHTWGPAFTRAITGRQPRGFDVTYYADQVNYVRTRPAPSANALRNVQVTYLQATKDALIESSAASAWEAAAGDADFRLATIDADHVSYDADPTGWNNIFRIELAELLQRM